MMILVIRNNYNNNGNIIDINNNYNNDNINNN